MNTERGSPIKLVDFGLGKMVDCHGANNKVQKKAIKKKTRSVNQSRWLLSRRQQ
jgi:hypothetical protein